MMTHNSSMPLAATLGSSRTAYVKKGEPPSICTSFASPGALRNASTSDGVLNWGKRVSNFVLTRTVRDRVGSTCRHIVKDAINLTPTCHAQKPTI